MIVTQRKYIAITTLRHERIHCDYPSLSQIFDLNVAFIIFMPEPPLASRIDRGAIQSRQSLRNSTGRRGVDHSLAARDKDAAAPDRIEVAAIKRRKPMRK